MNTKPRKGSVGVKTGRGVEEVQEESGKQVRIGVTDNFEEWGSASGGEKGEEGELRDE